MSYKAYPIKPFNGMVSDGRKETALNGVLSTGVTHDQHPCLNILDQDALLRRVVRLTGTQWELTVKTQITGAPPGGGHVCYASSEDNTSYFLGVHSGGQKFRIVINKIEKLIDMPQGIAASDILEVTLAATAADTVRLIANNRIIGDWTHGQTSRFDFKKLFKCTGANFHGRFHYLSAKVTRSGDPVINLEAKEGIGNFVGHYGKEDLGHNYFTLTGDKDVNYHWANERDAPSTDLTPYLPQVSITKGRLAPVDNSGSYVIKQGDNISFTFRQTEVGNGQAYMQGTMGNIEFQLIMENDGTLLYREKTTPKYKFKLIAKIEPNEWYHLTLVRHSNDLCVVYFNNIPVLGITAWGTTMTVNSIGNNVTSSRNNVYRIQHVTINAHVAGDTPINFSCPVTDGTNELYDTNGVKRFNINATKVEWKYSW